ncbi:MAG: hypothetical protein EOO43_13700 [Flavobacterium sp.]|nr:MAG: hypothetical protein EOO43_13700 [Flavobacterium sp.]
MIKLHPNPTAAKELYLQVKDQLIIRIKKAIKGKFKKTDKKTKAKTAIAPSIGLIGYLTSLTTGNGLEALVTAQANDFKAIIAYLKSNFPNVLVAESDENLLFRNIFHEHGYKNIDKFDLIQKIAIDTCPYCNRNYTYSISKKSLIKPEIDHFYPTSIYPIFAVSFYNLIPSCLVCNGLGAKKNADPEIEGLTNPYLIQPFDFKFTFKIASVNVLNPLSNKYGVHVKFLNQIPGHLKVFKLDELYFHHSDHVLELIIKSKIKYSESYRQYLKDYEELHFSDDEINRMILGNYSLESEIHKRPFAKLYQDIGKELGLIE